VVALDRGMVHWVDPFLVRREIGAEPLDIVGTGTARRALREAYVLQYQAHLADVLAQPGAERRFAASEHFFALPPAGTLPAAAINPADFTQIYFPPEVDVSLAAIPEDELAPLVRESLSLPPIDLTLSGDDLAWTSVLILIPLPRDVLRRTAGVPPAGSGTPVSSAALVPLGTSLSDPTWRALVGRVDPLWYVRRRNLPYKADVVGQAVDPPLITVDRESAILARLAPIGLDTEYQQLKARASTDLLAEVQLLLSSFPTDHVLLFAGAMHALRASLPDPTPPPPNPAQLTHQMIVNVAALFTDPTRGGGLAKLEDASADFKATPWAAALASAGTWNDLHSGSILQLDALAASRDAAGTLATLVTGLHGIAQPPTAANVANFVKGQS
jgi:hypothetical protein